MAQGAFAIGFVAFPLAFVYITYRWDHDHLELRNIQRKHIQTYTEIEWFRLSSHRQHAQIFQILPPGHSAIDLTSN